MRHKKKVELYCPKCSAELKKKNGMTFCPKCGEVVTEKDADHIDPRLARKEGVR